MAQGDGETPETGGFRQKLRTWWRQISFTAVLVILALLAGEFRPLRELDAILNRPGSLHTSLLSVAIALAAVGSVMMLGAQFLPEPRRREHRPADAALDAAAVPMEFQEQGARFERSMEASATADEIREALRRRSWRYSRRWRIVLVMMLGALLMVLGLAGLFFVIGPPFLKVLVAGFFLYFAVLIGWEFWVK